MMDKWIKEKILYIYEESRVKRAYKLASYINEIYLYLLFIKYNMLKGNITFEIILKDIETNDQILLTSFFEKNGLKIHQDIVSLQYYRILGGLMDLNMEDLKSMIKDLSNEFEDDFVMQLNLLKSNNLFIIRNNDYANYYMSNQSVSYALPSDDFNISYYKMLDIILGINREYYFCLDNIRFSKFQKVFIFSNIQSDFLEVVKKISLENTFKGEIIVKTFYKNIASLKSIDLLNSVKYILTDEHNDEYVYISFKFNDVLIEKRPTIMLGVIDNKDAHRVEEVLSSIEKGIPIKNTLIEVCAEELLKSANPIIFMIRNEISDKQNDLSYLVEQNKKIVGDIIKLNKIIDIEMEKILR